jgi:adenylate cyclase
MHLLTSRCETLPTTPSIMPDALRHLRLASGQVLWTYIAFHFLNHSLGLVSLDAAEGALKIAAAVWQSWPGTVLLYGAFCTHLVLALTSLHQRHTLLLPPLELMRIAFGLTIPLLLIGHVVSTRVAFVWYGEAAQYQRIVANLARDGNTGWQLALLAPGWLHGCMGLNVAFRHRAWYQRWRWWLIGFATVLPLSAAAGYWSLLLDVRALGLVTLTAPVGVGQRVALGELRENILSGYIAVIALVFISRTWRDWRNWRASRVRVPVEGSPP